MWTGLKNLTREEEVSRTAIQEAIVTAWSGKVKGGKLEPIVTWRYERGLLDRSYGCRAMKLLQDHKWGMGVGVKKKTRSINIPIFLLSSSKLTSCASYWPNPTGLQNVREPRRCIGEGQPPEHSTGGKEQTVGWGWGRGKWRLTSVGGLKKPRGRWTWANT